MEETSRRGILGRHQSCFAKRIEVLSDTIERIILQETLPAYCTPKVVRVGTGEKFFASPRPPPKISLKQELGSEVARQPEREVPQQAEGSQPNPNPNHDGTERPVVRSEKASRSHEIETRSSREKAENHDKTERPVVLTIRATNVKRG